MGKKKLHKRIRHIHKKKSAWFWVIGLLILAIIFVNSKDRSASSPNLSAYQSIDDEVHEGYEEPAPGEYKEAIIRIKDGKFVPEKIEVDSETLIIFENEESVPHVVVSDNLGKEDEISFDTGDLPYEEKVETVEYGLPGIYPYHDKLNPQIKGTIVVKEGNG